MAQLDGTRSCQTQKVGRLRVGRVWERFPRSQRERERGSTDTKHARQQDIFSEKQRPTTHNKIDNSSLLHSHALVVTSHCQTAWVTQP